MRELDVPEIRIKKTPQLSSFPLCRFNDLAQFIPASEKNRFQAKPFSIAFALQRSYRWLGLQRGLLILETWPGSR